MMKRSASIPVMQMRSANENPCSTKLKGLCVCQMCTPGDRSFLELTLYFIVWGFFAMYMYVRDRHNSDANGSISWDIAVTRPLSRF